MRATRAIGSSSPTHPSLVLVLACCMFRLFVVLLVLACSVYSDLSVRRAVSRASVLWRVVVVAVLAFYGKSLSRVPAHIPVALELEGRSLHLA